MMRSAMKLAGDAREAERKTELLRGQPLLPLHQFALECGNGRVASTEGEGEGAAAEAVKAAIRVIIDNEADILSDDAIAGLLKQRGFDCARRTVVKYRESMGIGSSVQRRRLRKIAGAA